jgi:hypothetical protein
MHIAGTTVRQGLILGLAGVEAGTMLVSSAARHAGWWLDWHTRTHPGGGSQGDEAALTPCIAAVRLVRAAKAA